MRIGVLFGYGLHGSGSCVYVQEILDAFCRLGHDCTLLCHEGNPDAIAELVGHAEQHSWGISGETKFGHGTLSVRSYALARVPVTYPRPEIKNGMVLSDMSSDQCDAYVDTMLEHLLDVHEESGFDVLLVNHTCLLVEVAARFRSITGTPFRVVVHGTGVHYGLRRSELLRERVTSALAGADAVVSLNKSVRHRLRAVLPNTARIECKQIPPGTNTVRFAFTATKNNYVAYVGRLILDKGVHCLLAAWPIIAAANPDVELRIAGDGCDADRLRRAWGWLRQGDRTRFRDTCVPRGEDASGREGWQKLMEPLDRFLASQGSGYDWLCVNARDTVRFLGAQGRPEIAQLICHARLMVLPSLAPEAHPLAVCEALSAGTPCIGTNEAGIKWILKRAEKHAPELKSRLRVLSEPSAFASGLARHAIALLRTPPKPATMLKVSSYVSKHFSWASAAEQILSGVEVPVGTRQDVESILGVNA